jgi:hypothetical protein
LGAFPALRAGNRAFRSNLFCRKAAKKDFRFNPLRGAFAVLWTLNVKLLLASCGALTS